MSLESAFCFGGAKDDGFVRTPLTGGRGRPLESRDDDVLATFSVVVVVVVNGEVDLDLVVDEDDVGSALVENDLVRGEDGVCA